MPSKKVTLRLDDEIVERAKAYCKRHGTNLSRVVETYLAALTDGNYNLMPRVKRLMGTLSAENEREDG